MNTDDLIDSLSSAAANPPRARVSLPVAVSLGAMVSLLLMVLILGLRIDWQGFPAWSGLSVKLTLAAIVLSLAVVRVRPAIRPEATLKGSLKVFVWPLLGAGLLALGSLSMHDPATWLSQVKGTTLAVCLTAIPLLSLPVLVATLLVLRQGAVSDAWRAGLLAGLLAGSTAVLVYALHCTEDEPAFYVTWYTAGVAIVTLLGGMLGRLLLRW
jgi:hypothetical protein